uniref:Uncharacterized protein ycf33 n=1 Tax=Dipterocladia arabiensis TaxID=2007176 RepID=A0A1Z1M0A5_9FLOR|nr:hypothetical protein [Dipterocladia arabiensis]ARW59458.1 hypothetical protein [Dipterocladia arabiensis]
MYNFWNNLNKFPRFLLAVMIGFFLTTFKPIFKLLKNKKMKIATLIIIIITITGIYLIIKLMTE